jgi:hypothetical protein
MNERVMQGREPQCKLYKRAWSVRSQTFALPALYPHARRVISGNLVDVAGPDGIAICAYGPTDERYFDPANERNPGNAEFWLHSI